MRVCHFDSTREFERVKKQSECQTKKKKIFAVLAPRLRFHGLSSHHAKLHPHAKKSSMPHRTHGHSIWLPALMGTMLIEAITLVLRFGAGLESTRDTASTIGWLTGGLRIHHGYIGLLFAVIALVLIHRAERLSRYLLIAGIALVLSDAIHHFVVLAYWFGDPQFDLWYAQ